MKKVILFLSLLSASYQAISQEIKGETIITGATNSAKSKTDVSATVDVIDSDAIRQDSSATLADLLATIPGVVVEQNGNMSGLNSISIRGEKGNRILIIVDGVKMTENSSPNGAPFLIDPNIIERIELIKGPAAVSLYGSDAIGGVINIITKKEKEAKAISGDTSHLYNSANNSYSGSVNLFGRIKNFDYRTGFTIIEAQDRKLPDGTSVDKTAFRNMGWNGVLGYNWDTGRIGINYDAYYAKPGVPDVVTEAMGSTVTAITTPYYWNRDTVSLSYVQDFDQDYLSRLSSRIYYQQIRKHIDSNWVMGNGADFLFSQMQNRQHSYGANFQADLSFTDENYFIVGLDYMGDLLLANNRDKSMVTGNQWRNSIFNATRNTWAIFAQDEWQVIDELTLTMGLRYNMALTGISSITESSNAMEVGSRFDQRLTGNIGLVYEPLKGFNMRINYGHGYRTPTITESVAGSIGHGGLYTIDPNPQIKPEQNHQTELGFRYFANNFDVDLVAAYSYGLNFITTVKNPATAGATLIYDNVDHAHTATVELTARYLIEPIHLSPYLSATYIYRYFYNDGFGTSETGLMPWMGRIGLAYNQKYSETIGFRANFYSVLASASMYKESADQESTKMAAYYTLNLGFGLDFFNKNNLSLDFGINNITNSSYMVGNDGNDHGVSQIAEGRHFYAKLTAKF